MKKLISAFLILCLVLSVSGCSLAKKTPSQKVTFYYKASQLSYGDEQSVFKTELRTISADALALADVIRLYLLGSESEEAEDCFPTGTTLVDLQVDENNATVVLGGNYASLSGYERTIACACLTMTVCSFANVPQITVLAENDPLESEKGIVMRPEDLISLDTSKIPIDNNE